MSANENDSNSNSNNGVTEVEVTGFNMPFMSLVGFMVKAAIASIPAMIIVALFVWVPILLTGTIIAVTP